MRLFDEYFACLVALADDIDTVCGIVYAYALEVVVDCGSVVVSAVSDDVVDAGASFAVGFLPCEYTITIVELIVEAIPCGNCCLNVSDSCCAFNRVIVDESAFAYELA